MLVFFEKNFKIELPHRKITILLKSRLFPPNKTISSQQNCVFSHRIETRIPNRNQISLSHDHTHKFVVHVHCLSCSLEMKFVFPFKPTMNFAFRKSNNFCSICNFRFGSDLEYNRCDSERCSFPINRHGWFIQC